MILYCTACTLIDISLFQLLLLLFQYEIFNGSFITAWIDDCCWWGSLNKCVNNLAPPTPKPSLLIVIYSFEIPFAHISLTNDSLFPTKHNW